MSNEPKRSLCTKENPYSKERDQSEPGWGWEHEGAHEVPDSQEPGYPSGDTVTIICPNCGITWTTELAQ